MAPAARILVIAGASAPDSPASLAAAALARELAFLDVAVRFVSLADYPLPLHDADRPAVVPPAAQRLRDLLGLSDAVFLAAAGTAGTLPAVARNLLEWLAPAPADMPGPALALAATGENEADAAATLAELAHAARRLLGQSAVASLAIGHANVVFDARGRITDARVAVALQRLARSLAEAGQRLAEDN